MPRVAHLRHLAAVLAALGLPGTAAPAPGSGQYGPEPRVRLSPAENQATALALARFSADGARPRVSGALVIAARLLARAADEGEDATRRRVVRDALARALAYDAAPMIYLARGTTPDLVEGLEDALGPGLGSATQVGAGVVERGGGFVAVVLASARGAQLDAFPQRVAAGARAELSGQLRAGLCDARVFVTRPSGRVQELAAPRGVRFRVTLTFDEPGRHAVEVVADGPEGPTVAALFPVAAGAASIEEPRGRAADEPRGDAAGAHAADPAGAEAAVLAALQTLRAQRGLSRVVLDPRLSEVARRHSEAMRAAGTIGHALRGSPGPEERLRAARLPYRRLYENVAAAASALEAHAAAEASPAHLRNMLEPGIRKVGVGLARELSASGRTRVYLTEIFVE
jgi:uncharacterized protein YkwD